MERASAAEMGEHLLHDRGERRSHRDHECVGVDAMARALDRFDRGGDDL